MGTGLGTGEGAGKGVKGGWLVSAFLLVLTGWQAVLFPWSPLILRDAGFSATSVGVLSGGTTMAASVGVVVCLRGMKRTRSGAVRRLLLWLMLVTAVILQGSGVGLVLRHLSQGGAMPSCVNGWLFGPPTPAFLLNNVSTLTTSRPPTILSSQQPHNLSTTPADTNSITSTIGTLPPTQPVPATSAKTTATTTVKTTTISSSPVTTTSKSIAVPTVETSTKAKENSGEKTTGKGSVTVAPHRAPVGHRHHQTAHKPLTPPRFGRPGKNRHSNVDVPDAPYKNSSRGGKHKVGKTTNRNLQVPDDEDDSEDDLEDDGTLEGVRGVYGNSEEDEEGNQDVSEYDDIQKLSEHYPRSGSRYRPSLGKLSPSSLVNPLPNFIGKNHPNPDIAPKPLQYNKATKFDMLWNSHVQESQNNPVKSLQNPHYFDDSVSSGNVKQNIPSAPLPVQSQQYLPDKPLPPRRPHISRPIKHPSYGETQNRDYDRQQMESRRTVHTRSRRDVKKTEQIDHIHPVKVATNETEPQRDAKLEITQNLFEKVKSGTVKVGVAVLLVVGGLVGAGVEAAVAQLWHCYVHGYDENGVSQDVLQRTITHTFHLSVYGNHKTWTGITSGGWAIGAGVMSLLACLAGAGGGGYGGLLGVHLALGLGALLLLLVLPVPYGSITPPRTRRPLSLYLDDEVLREGVRRLTFHLWVFVNGCLTALSLTFSLWLLQDMTAEGWLVGGQASAVAVTLVCESLALHTQRRLVIRSGLHGLMGVCGVSLMLHYGIMWASNSVVVVVVAHAGLGVAMAFLWVAVKHNALLLATVSDQEREAWASWWCWRFGVSVGAAVWGVAVSGAGEKVRPLLLLATIASAILASSLCVTAVLSRRHSRTRRRVYHTLDLDIANDEVDEEENDAAEDDWLVKRAKKEGLSL